MQSSIEATQALGMALLRFSEVARTVVANAFWPMIEAFHSARLHGFGGFPTGGPNIAYTGWPRRSVCGQ